MSTSFNSEREVWSCFLSIVETLSISFSFFATSLPPLFENDGRFTFKTPPPVILVETLFKLPLAVLGSTVVDTPPCAVRVIELVESLAVIPGPERSDEPLEWLTLKGTDFSKQVESMFEEFLLLELCSD